MRMTHASVSVARVLMSDPDHEWYGYEVAKQAAVKSGVLYPILSRMRAQDWIVSHWEDTDQHHEARPSRYYCQVTPKGRQALRAMLDTACTDRRFKDWF
jgi:PadR family transcriptional regulator PadR